MIDLITKMSFVNITGPRQEIDRIADTYISKYDMELEYAPSEMKTIVSLSPYTQTNPYKEQIKYGEELVKYFGDIIDIRTEINIDQAAQVIEDIYFNTNEIRSTIEKYNDEKSQLNDMLSKVLPFKELNYNMEDILGLKSLRYRFGRIPKEYFSRMMNYVIDDIRSIFISGQEDDEYVWGLYFVPIIEKDVVDAEYTSLHFERTFFPGEVHGTPHEEIKKINGQIKGIDKLIENENIKLKEIVEKRKDEFQICYSRLKRYYFSFEVRRFAACTKEEGLSYFILCGWMAEKDAKLIYSEIHKNEQNTICILDDAGNTSNGDPPTKLKNPYFLKPFEMFVKMYGMPSYNEIDPTLFVALTYAFIFGAMFGDVGQGISLIIIGMLIYKIKKMSLGAIISFAGVFSTFFGFMFGSIFGFEDVIGAVWLHPTNAMTELPFIGKINTVFVVAVTFGMGIVIIAQIFHIINAIKAKDTENKWFDANGVAGLVFYVSSVVVLILFMTGNPIPGAIIMFIMFGIPLILIAIKEPLTRLITGKKDLIEGSFGIYIVQTFFEMFEVLLSYFSNTLSFLRIGAFAVSHAAMMEVVLMLAGVENGGSGNIVIVIVGNVIVCGLEGLIVGIQVLRLEYYEMFSRFYKGAGREFKPYKGLASEREK